MRCPTETEVVREGQVLLDVALITGKASSPTEAPWHLVCTFRTEYILYVPFRAFVYVVATSPNWGFCRSFSHRPDGMSHRRVTCDSFLSDIVLFCTPTATLPPHLVMTSLNWMCRSVSYRPDAMFDRRVALDHGGTIFVGHRFVLTL